MVQIDIQETHNTVLLPFFFRYFFFPFRGENSHFEFYILEVKAKHDA